MNYPHIGIGTDAYRRPPAIHTRTHEPAYAVEHALAIC